MSDFSYDAFPYDSYPFEYNTPETLAVLARLFGLESPDIESCRVLELGCASGGNIIPLAELYPNAEFVGIDMSPRQINDGKEMIVSTGLSNIRLEAMSVTDIGPDFGTFDYIIAHGLFSWVDTSVQDAVLRVCRQNLSPRGVALISFNTRPGWNAVLTVRDLMLFHTANIADPVTRISQGKSVVQFMIDGLEGSDAAHARTLQDEMNLLKTKADSYVFHDHFEQHNTPFYFHEFAARAHEFGLKYLADTDLPSMFPDNLPAKVAAQLRSNKDIVVMEQYMDFLRNRRFRNTLVVHQNVVIKRNLTPEVLRGFYLSANVTSQQPLVEAQLKDTSAQQFRFGESGYQRVENPVSKIVLHTLASQGIAPWSVAELAAKVLQQFPLYAKPAVERHILYNMDLLNKVCAGSLRLRMNSGKYLRTAPQRPKISRVAMYQCMQGRPLTNSRHQNISVEDLVPIIRLMDGTRTLSDIVDAMEVMASSGQLSFNETGVGEGDFNRRAVLEAACQRVVQRLTGLALFVA